LQPTPETLAALDRAAVLAAPLAARFAVLCASADSAAGLQALLDHLRADTDSLQLAVLLRELRPALGAATGAEAMAGVLERADVLRRPPRFEQLLLAFQALDRQDVQRWRDAAAAYAAIDAGAVARAAGPDPAAIACAVAAARRAALSAALS
jgi:tRNA nucleotidyltransferase (CCA-adding enzyme)